MSVDFRVGTSGYSYPAWKGTFYPEDLPSDQMLKYYAGQFSTVEINNTFYRMPNVATFDKWRTQVPDNFSFVLKAPQQITHKARLKQAGNALEHFYKACKGLDGRRSATLYQLPPFLKKDVPRLTDFLAALPTDERVAFEFRHESWFDDGVYSALQARGAALCLADSDDLNTPRQMTADWGYVRLRRSAYSAKALRIWHAWIGAQTWREVFVFFKHEDSGTGPALAHELLKIIADT